MDLFLFTMQQLAPPVAFTRVETIRAIRRYLRVWLRRHSYLAPRQALRPDLQLLKDLDLDALARLELMGDLETYYGVQIPDEEIDKLATVRDVEDRLCQYLVQAA